MKVILLQFVIGEEDTQDVDSIRRVVVPGSKKRKRDNVDDMIQKVTSELQRDRLEFYKRQDDRERLREEERKRRVVEDAQMHQMMSLMNNTMVAIADSIRSLNARPYNPATPYSNPHFHR